MSSSFGNAYRITVFGSSHQPCIGVTVEGLPAGFRPDLARLQEFLDRRRPQSVYATARREADVPEFVSGFSDGAATGEPATVLLRNTDVKREDYAALRTVPRPGHADYPAMVKYGAGHESGGGEFSGRMTAPLCVAGGLALQLLAQRGIGICARIESIGGETGNFDTVLEQARAEGDSVGGVIACEVLGLPVGLGGALFDGLESRIAACVYGIPAVKGVEFGAGFAAASMRGSENNDAYFYESGAVRTRSNHAGGILGGMANGMPLTFRAAIKPTPSITKPQRSVDLEKQCETQISVTGRHDVCIVPRAVPCVEAAAACALLDVLLEQEKPSTLAGLRSELDTADRALLRAFDARMALSREIGKWKKANGKTVRDPAREADKMRKAAAYSAESAAAEQLFETLMRLSREEQEKL